MTLWGPTQWKNLPFDTRLRTVSNGQKEWLAAIFRQGNTKPFQPRSGLFWFAHCG
jgi:hypothetical protein